MARQARKKSESGYYHIMVRGNNKERVFEKAQDKEKVIEILQKIKDENAIIIYAYCLMDNHIHIVLKDKKNEIGMTMRRFGVFYSRYYNKENKRVGHVFQERYKSEAIEDESYLMAVIRYVHKNPVKAKIVKQLDEYVWSSYSEYINDSKELVSIEDILGINVQAYKKGLKDFIEFHKEDDNRVFLEDREEQEEMEISKAWDIVENKLTYASSSVGEVGKRYIAQIMVTESNLSKRKIAEIVGLNRNTVQRMKKEK